MPVTPISHNSAFFSARQFDNNRSLALANGWVHIFASGTSTYLPLYSDINGTATANPTQLDGSGKYWVYGPQVACKVIITDVDGNQIDEQDPVWLFGQSGGGNGTGSLAVVANYAELRALTQDYDLVIVLGYAAAGDGGFGCFERISSSSAPDNDGTVLIRGSASRYVRQYQGWIDPRWFGMVYDATVDQMGALDKALAVGPTRIQGNVYIDQDHHLTGVLSALSGGFRSAATPKLYLDGILEAGCAGMFGAGIQVQFNKGVAEEIRLSWFAGGLAQSLCTSYSYRYLVDVDLSVTSFPWIPGNYAVDFPNGSWIQITGATDVRIDNLVYTGTTRILGYTDISYVQAVHLGGGPCLLEWFGGIPGPGIGVDNRIPAKAAFAHGDIKLIASYYRVPSAGAAWALSHPVKIQSADALSYPTLDLSQSVTCTDLTTFQVNLTGAATVTSTGVADIKYSTVTDLDTQPSGTTQDLRAAVSLPSNYFVGGNAGMLRNSTDLATWTPHTVGAAAIRGLAKGPVWIAVSDAGAAWRSLDGGVTWTGISIGASTLYAVRYLQGKFVALGVGGAIYVSTDGYTWNNRSIATSATLRDIAYSAASGLYIIVGTVGTVLTSGDLISWTPRTLPSGVTGDLYAVACYANAAGTIATTIISGALGGRYLLASDSVSYQAFALVNSETIYGIAVSPEAILLSSGSGKVYVSASAGQQFLPTQVGNNAGLCAAYTQGQFAVGTAGGNVLTTSDLKAWTTHYVGAATDILALSIQAPVYAVVGAANVVLTSPSGNGRDWVPVTVAGSGTWNQCRVLNGMAFLVGAGGRAMVTTDFRGFVTVNTGVTSDLWDIAFDSVSDRYAVCGSGGVVRWCTRADILAPSPAWTQITTGTSTTLTRAAWTGSVWTFGGSDSLVVSTDLTNGGTQLLANVYRGMLVAPITGGTLYILYGDQGLILTSTDKLTWTKRVSGVTSTLRCGVVNSGFAMIAGDNGVLLRADVTSPGTWTSISVGTSNTINALAYSSGRSELGLCGAAGIAYRSVNNGVTWIAMATGSGQDMYGIWGQGTSWECVGAAGKWYTTSNGSSWTARTTNTTAAIRCGTANLAFGDGFVAYQDAYVHQQANRFGVAGVNFVAVQANTLLTSTGATYQFTQGPHFQSTTNSVTCLGAGGNAGTATSLTLDAANNTLYAVGGNAMSAATSATSYLDFVPVLSAYTGVRDLQYISGWLWIVGDTGLVAKSSNGYAWVNQAARGDTTQRLNVRYYLATGGLAQTPGILGYAEGNPAIAAGASGLILAGAGPALPALVLAGASIQDSVIRGTLTTSKPASVLRSILRSLDNAGSLSDAQITDGLANAYGNILRSEIDLVAPLSVHGDILISESEVTKIRSWDRSGVLFGSVSGTLLQVDATKLEYQGLLAYSEDAALAIRLNECRNSSNFAGALTNGYAKVYLANCNAAPNSSAYSVDGSTLDAGVTIGASQEITGSLTDWSGLPAGTTTDTHKLTLAAPATLGPSATSPTTLRWHGTSTAIKLLQNAGGRIKLEIVYPAGYTPNSQAQVRVALVKPQLGLFLDASNGGLLWSCPVNDPLTLGVQTPAPVTRTAGKLTTYANVWGGYADIYRISINYGSSQWIADPWSDVASNNGPYNQYQTPWPNSSVVVVWATADLVLPIGTSIQITLLPQLPQTRTELQTWYNSTDRTLDPYQSTERQQLAFESADSVAGLELAYSPVAGAYTSEDVNWLSLFYNTYGPNIYKYTANGVSTIPYSSSYGYVSAVTPTNKALLWTGLASATKQVRLSMAALPDTAWHDVDQGQAYKLGLQANGNYVKFQGYNIANGAWTTLTVTRVTLP